MADAAALAEVQSRARAAAPMPPGIHTDDEIRGFLATRLVSDDVWVATVDAVVVGYLRLTPTWLDDLYVLPGHAGQGIGSALLELAKQRRPAGFSLWVFETNAPARRFYRRHGLVEREYTDGTQNEEREPDLRMSWEAR